jgi:N-methylhydantoinase A/oxoprolinase/acetone carboxylase beta subunit
VTDADVALGMIDPAAFAGGTISLNPDLARAALATAVGDPLGMSPETCRLRRCTRWCARTWRAPRACTRSSAARS